MGTTRHNPARTKPPLEREIQREICDWMKERGLFFWRSNNTPQLGKPDATGGFRFRAMPKYAMKGVPDIICVHKGVFYGIEVKRPGAYIRPEQATFGEKLNKNGGEYHVVKSLDEAKDIFRGVLTF